MTNPIIQFHNVHYAYNRHEADPVSVLRGINLSVNRGEFVAVLGHNGSGKSTLAKHCNAILVPGEGKVTVDGLDSGDENVWLQIRQRVGMVFQNPDNQIVATVVEEDVAFACENLGMPPPQIRERVDAALHTVGMYSYRNHAPHKLSGGQKQRVAIAGVLAMQPDVLVLDEPTAMLDPIGRTEIMNTLHDLNAQGITVILVTHHMQEAAAAGRVLVMRDGQIVIDSPPRETFQRVAELHDMQLSAPQTTELLYALRQRGYDVTLDALTAEECASVLEKFLS
jgi:energy-coupling factor transport system ATP-binding protein